MTGLRSPKLEQLRRAMAVLVAAAYCTLLAIVGDVCGRAVWEAPFGFIDVVNVTALESYNLVAGPWCRRFPQCVVA
jgi:hypothetical protein